jgi:hypothetical protein
LGGLLRFPLTTFPRIKPLFARRKRTFATHSTQRKGRQLRNPPVENVDSVQRIVGKARKIPKSLYPTFDNQCFLTIPDQEKGLASIEVTRPDSDRFVDDF